jgi:hypothetical protein
MAEENRVGGHLKETVVNLTRKAWRRALAVPPRVRQRVRRFDKTRAKLLTYGDEWSVEREIARLTRGNGRIIVGPWLSEVGYEVLYWVPFVRWVQKRYDVDPARFVIVTRGGAAAWYDDISHQAVEVFDLLDAADFARRNEQRASEGRGTLKQFDSSALDRELIDGVRLRLGAAEPQVLHPSLLYRLFHQFWLGHRPQEFYDGHTRHARIAAPKVPVPIDLPPQYVAVKLYTAAALPATPVITRTLRSLVLAIAERMPVVMLDTGMMFDDHGEHVFDGLPRVQTLRGSLDARDNLAVQTTVIAGAQSFVGTCGALAWLAPMLGVDTTAVMADPRFLHHHLQVARRVYQRMEGAGRFSVLDIGAFQQLGLSPELRFVPEPTA